MDDWCVEYTLIPEDQGAVVAQYMRTRFGRLMIVANLLFVIVAIAICAGALYGVMAIPGQTSGSVLWRILSVLAVLVFLFVYLSTGGYATWLERWLRTTGGRLAGPASTKVNERFVSQAGPGIVTYELEWGLVKRLVLTDDYVLFTARGGRPTVWVPLRAFESKAQQNQFLDSIESRLASSQLDCLQRPV